MANVKTPRNRGGASRAMITNAYGDELRSLAAAGCTYVQMDDTNLAYLCDEKMREAARQRGDDPNERPHRYAKFIHLGLSVSFV